MLYVYIYWLLASRFAPCVPLDSHSTEKTVFSNLPVPVKLSHVERTQHLAIRKKFSYEPITPEDYDFFVTSLQKAIMLYDPKLVKKHVRAVIPVYGFTYDGVEYGGSYSTVSCGPKKYIYMSIGTQNNQRKTRYPASFLTQTFHHEFSSLLLDAYDFPAKEWQNISGPDFSYAFKDGFEALKAVTEPGGNAIQLKTCLDSPRPSLLGRRGFIT